MNAHTEYEIMKHEKNYLQENTRFDIGLEEADTVMVKERIGAGSFGEVWRATHLQKPKNYALKHINLPELIKKRYVQPENKALFIERIKHEASIFVPSEYVVRAYGFREIDGHFFLLFDFVAGDTLWDWLANHLETPWTYRKELFSKILRGVSDLHRAGVLHRDLKPGNVLVTVETQTPKIIDFGYAKIDGSKLSVSGDMSGTAVYKDPSMISLNKSNDWVGGIKYATAASDVYALGIMLYEMIVGLNPWKANNLAYEEIFNQIVGKNNVLDIDRAFRLDAPKEEVEAVKETIRRSTMFDRDMRLQTVEEMIARLGVNIALVKPHDISENLIRPASKEAKLPEKALQLPKEPKLQKEEKTIQPIQPLTVPDTITTQCNYCQNTLKVEAEKIGKNVQCPKCSGIFVAEDVTITALRNKLPAIIPHSLQEEKLIILAPNISHKEDNKPIKQPQKVSSTRMLKIQKDLRHEDIKGIIWAMSIYVVLNLLLSYIDIGDINEFGVSMILLISPPILGLVVFGGEIKTIKTAGCVLLNSLIYVLIIFIGYQFFRLPHESFWHCLERLREKDVAVWIGSGISGLGNIVSVNVSHRPISLTETITMSFFYTNTLVQKYIVVFRLFVKTVSPPGRCQPLDMLFSDRHSAV